METLIRRRVLRRLTSCSAASNLGLHCLPITLLGVSWLQWVKNLEPVSSMVRNEAVSQYLGWLLYMYFVLSWFLGYFGQHKQKQEAKTKIYIPVQGDFERKTEVNHRSLKLLFLSYKCLYDFWRKSKDRHFTVDKVHFRLILWWSLCPLITANATSISPPHLTVALDRLYNSKSDWILIHS